MSATIGNNLPNYNHQQARIDPAAEKSQAPGTQPELSPVEDRVTISSGDDTFPSATLERILSGISSLSGQDLGQIHQLDPAMVGSLLAD
jgi:hypothetical protein